MGDEDDSLLLFPSEPLGEAEEDESDHEDCKILDPPEQGGEVEEHPEADGQAAQAEAAGEETSQLASETKEKKG